MNNLSALKEQYAKLGEEITKLQDKEDNVWPKVGEDYFFLSGNGEKCWACWVGGAYDKLRQSIGNIYRSTEDLDKQLETLKVIAELRACEGRKSFVVDEANYCIVPDYEDRTVVVHTNYVSDCGWQSIYFNSQEAVQNAINKVGADRILAASTWLAMGK